MRKRLMAVAAVGLVALGIWLGDWFNGPGTGKSDSSDEQTDVAPEDVQVNLDAESQSATHSQPVEETEPSTSEPAADVLTVLVEGDAYQVQAGEDDAATFAPATLEEVVEQARNSPGDTHGVRVRLRYRRDSQEGARADLIKALQLAEIEREQIIEATDFVK